MFTQQITQPHDETLLQLAAALRAVCAQAAQDGYAEAAADGLCHEGAWECALQAIRSVDLLPLLQTATANTLISTRDRR